MNFFGIDFTSAPRRRKWITCASGVVDHDRITLQHLDRWDSYEPLVSLLESDRPKVIGLDFPFGLPRPLIDDAGFGEMWAEVVRNTQLVGIERLAEIVKAYRDCHPKGQKEPPRVTDRAAKSISAMKMDYIPVGRMYFRGTPLLLNAAEHTGLQIWPVFSPEKADRDRIAVEVYPALVARQIIGRASYKSDDPRKQTALRLEKRQKILDALTSGLPIYGAQRFADFSTEQTDAILADATGDLIDAVLALWQTVWIARYIGSGGEVPARYPLIEGWIADPTTL